MRMQEIRWPRPGDRTEKKGKEHKCFLEQRQKKGKQERGMGACVPTFEDVLELVLLQGGPHDLLDGRDVLVQLDH